MRACVRTLAPALLSDARMHSVGPRKPSYSARLLKYRFGSIEQVTRHFHVTPGRVVLFYPTLATLTPGEQVILCVTFVESDQECILRGTVLGKELDSHFGWWLEFSAHSVVSSLRSPAASPKR